MAVEQIGPDVTQSMRHAVHELRLAILALECGEPVSAENHMCCAKDFMRDLLP